MVKLGKEQSEISRKKKKDVLEDYSKALRSLNLESCLYERIVCANPNSNDLYEARICYKKIRECLEKGELEMALVFACDCGLDDYFLKKMVRLLIERYIALNMLKEAYRLAREYDCTDAFLTTLKKYQLLKRYKEDDLTK